MPLRPAVQQVQVAIHGLHKGRVERLIPDTGKARRHRGPVSDSLSPTTLQLLKGARGVRRNGLIDHGRHADRRRTVRKAKRQSPLEVLLGLQRLILDRPIEALLACHGRITIRTQRSIHRHARHLRRGGGRVFT